MIMAWIQSLAERLLRMAGRDIVIYLVIPLLTSAAVVKAVYRLFFHPLHKIPGPFLAKITSQWSIITSLSGNRARIVHALHQKYGPIVRLGPNELSFTSQSAIDTIHHQNGLFTKAAVYDYIGEPSLFGMRDLAAHKERRRLLNHAFSQQYLYDMEPEFRGSLRKVIEVIDRAGGEPIDVKHWFKMYTLDNAGKAFVGASFNGLDSEETPQIAKDYDVLFNIWAGEAMFPVTMWILKLIPSAKLKHLFGAHDRIYQHGKDRLKEYVARFGRKSTRKDLLTNMIGKGEGDPDALPDKDIEAELGGLSFAATDTAAITLNYLFWELGRHPDVVAKVREELADIQLVDGAVPYTAAVTSRWLEAVFTESMRIHPVAPGGVPRDTPPGGYMIDGILVPGGTVVSTNTWTVHHDPTYFEDPYTFDPSRWLGKVSPEMRARPMPFLKGQYNCIGQHMALFQMKILTATLIKRYDIETPACMTPEVIDFKDHILAVPQAERCWIKFTPVQE